MEHELVTSARKLIGIPYFYKGRSGGGLDCGGMYITVINNTVDSTYNYTDYGINPNPNHIKRELLVHTDNTSVLEPGTILLIRIHALPQHIAIYTEVDTIIHTYEDIGKVVEEKLTKFWKDRIDSMYKLRS